MPNKFFKKYIKVNRIQEDNGEKKKRKENLYTL